MTKRKEELRKKPAAAVSDSDTVDTRAVSDFVTRSDEAAKRRLDNLNRMLMDLERQMEALEAEMRRAHDFSVLDLDGLNSHRPQTFQSLESFLE